MAWGTSSSWHEAFAEEDAGAWAAGAGDCSAAVLIGMLNMLCQHGVPLSWSLVLVFKKLCVVFCWLVFVFFTIPLCILVGKYFGDGLLYCHNFKSVGVVAKKLLRFSLSHCRWHERL